MHGREILSYLITINLRLKKIDGMTKQKGFADKSGISGFFNDSELNKIIEKLATKAELKVE